MERSKKYMVYEEIYDEDWHEYFAHEEETDFLDEALAIASTMTDPCIQDEYGVFYMVDGEIQSDYEQERAEFIEKITREEAERKAKEDARLATYGDEADKENIRNIVAYFNSRGPLRDYRPADAASKIDRVFPDWYGHHPSGGQYTVSTPGSPERREYMFQLKRGVYSITVEDVKRIY